MAKKSSDPVAKAVASMSQSGRQAVGNSMPSSARIASAETGRQKLVKKGHSKDGNNPSVKGFKTAIPQERLGARFTIPIALPGPESPEAYSTQANGRIVPSVMGSKNNFGDQRNFYGSR